MIIREDICIAQKKMRLKEPPEPIPPPPEPPEPPGPKPPLDGRDSVRLKFTIPRGKVAGLMGVMNLLQLNFDSLQIELLATEGQMSDQDYEDKIREAFVQLGIDPEE